MKIEYLHASKFGNGAVVADEFKSGGASYMLRVADA